jgi:hypothetical protein
VLAPGDVLESTIIQQIFYWFVHCRISAAEIALRLNWNCYPRRRGLTAWDAQYVLRALAEENYVGTATYGRQTQRMRTPYRAVPRDQWIRVERSFQGIVSEADFEEAQRLRTFRKRPKWSDEALLNLLRQVYNECGYVNSKLLFERTTAPGTHPYQLRFGSISDACKLVGLPTTEHMEVCSLRSKQRQLHKMRLIQWLDERYCRMGIGFYWHKRNRRVCVEGALTFSIRVVLSFRSKGSYYWELRADRKIEPDVCVFIRVARNGEEVLDYFVVPGKETDHIYINSKGLLAHDRFERFRCKTMEHVFRMLEVTRNTGEIRMTPMLAHRDKRRGTVLNPKEWRV